jgi:hypothetical protein
VRIPVTPDFLGENSGKQLLKIADPWRERFA